MSSIQTSSKNCKRLDLFVAAVILLLTAAILLFVNQLEYSSYSKGMRGASLSYESAKVTAIHEETLKDSRYSEKIQVGKQKLDTLILTGKHKGETLPVDNRLSTYNSVPVHQGQKLTVIIDELTSGKLKVRVYNYDRSNSLYLIVVLFLITMVLVSGKKGLMSCLNLIYTFTCILFLFLPLIMRGYSPVWVAIMLVIMVTTANMIFLNGISRKTLCAIVGTAAGVILSGIILLIFSRMLHVSGFNLDEAESLLFIHQKTGLGVENILFAAVLIASMGAVMDTALSIVSSINELHTNLPELSATKLFKGGMNVGKDMIGTMSNTLILAFVGAALPTILVLNFYSVQYRHLLSSNFVAIEIAQAISGSMAVVLTIPLTAAITAKFLKRHSVCCSGESIDRSH